ncbi:MULTISPECIES: hypothetical protein [Rhodobacterales]|uniref:Secreted protein n=1 Tax=Halocynthiibacter halioticoli TaxID=2986804 RepID=A0AAE3J1E5_9RHOB|nr:MULTISPECIES: hypothetical protein [Rhodobacterales]MCV6825970.1 hypothetical protein [Halocynthiibacter halioticoli]MCW4058971.1 hypothetical protein [Halocynthiibacter sp. SDUM655004]
MIRPTLIIATLVSAVASGAAAQFIPTLGSDTPRVCPDQPAQPEWIENIEPREAHTGHLVQMMYRAQGLQAVAEAGSCSCETRFPSWDKAQEYYFEHYSALERFEVQQRTSEYRRAANDARKIAQPICELENNW